MLKIIGLFIVFVIVVWAVQLGLLLHSIGKYREYWQTTAAKPRQENALTYIALGDSVAQSIGATSPMKGYVGLVAHALGQKEGRPVRIVNISVTGATVQSAIDEQLPKLQQLGNVDDAVITIDIGANDIVHGLDTTKFEKELDELLSQLPKQTVVADIPSFSRTRMPNLEPKVNEANPIIRKVAERYGLRIAPLNASTAQDKSLLADAADLFHPSNRGYRNWYRGFWEVLSK